MLIIPLLAVILVLYAFPIYWLIATSLKSRAQLFQATLSLFPEAPTLQPYTASSPIRSRASTSRPASAPAF